MADISAIFILVAMLRGDGDGFSISTLAQFPTEAACQTAAASVTDAVATGTPLAEVRCLPASFFTQPR